MYQSLKWRLMHSFRAERMRRFLRIMQPKPGATILDVGGLPSLNGIAGFWREYDDRFDITLVNMPGAFKNFNKTELSPFRLVEADVCNCDMLLGGYDIVFSNSVIEHVGSERRQEAFARFVRSAGSDFWVQTPSPLFPIEAHCDIPFWWFAPHQMRKRKISRWHRSGNQFLARQMASTRPISASRLRYLLPGVRFRNTIGTKLKCPASPTMSAA